MTRDGRARAVGCVPCNVWTCITFSFLLFFVASTLLLASTKKKGRLSPKRDGFRSRLRSMWTHPTSILHIRCVCSVFCSQCHPTLAFCEFECKFECILPHFGSQMKCTTIRPRGAVFSVKQRSNLIWSVLRVVRSVFSWWVSFPARREERFFVGSDAVWVAKAGPTQHPTRSLALLVQRIAVSDPAAVEAGVRKDGKASQEARQ